MTRVEISNDGRKFTSIGDFGIFHCPQIVQVEEKGVGA